MTDEKLNGEADAQDNGKRESEDIAEFLNKAKEAFDAIEKIKKTVESYSSDLSSLKKSAEGDSEAAHTAREESEKSKQSATEDAKAVQTLETEAEPLLAKIKANQTEAVALLGEIQTSENNAKRIAEIANEKDAKVDKYEEQLIDLTTQYSDIREQIESLLPGATSENLAFASKARKDSFKNPMRFWTFMHMIAVVSLVGVGVWALFTTDINNKSIRDVIFFILLRSPIIAAIILLEEFARRNRNIALRLEEDYGYKEVLSASFEGYKKEMEKIDLETKTLAVTKLSTNLLDAMAKEPGRLIDKEKPESVESSLLESTLSQIKIPEGESKEGVLCRIYEDIKKSFKGKIINIVIIIALSIAAGIGIGYYIGLTLPNS